MQGCHCEALRAHLEIKHSTSVHVNDKKEVECTSWWFCGLLQSLSRAWLALLNLNDILSAAKLIDVLHVLFANGLAQRFSVLGL